MISLKVPKRRTPMFAAYRISFFQEQNVVLIPSSFIGSLAFRNKRYCIFSSAPVEDGIRRHNSFCQPISLKPLTTPCSTFVCCVFWKTSLCFVALLLLLALLQGLCSAAKGPKKKYRIKGFFFFFNRHCIDKNQNAKYCSSSSMQ